MFLVSLSLWLNFEFSIAASTKANGNFGAADVTTQRRHFPPLVWNLMPRPDVSH